MRAFYPRQTIGSGAPGRGDAQGPGRAPGSASRRERAVLLVRHELVTGEFARLDLDSESRRELRDEYVAEAFDRIESMIDVILVVTQGCEAVDDQTRVQLAAMAWDAWGDVDTADATLEVTVDGAIRADETYIRHLFRNLFENAVDHGGPAVTVTVGDLPTGFYVADTGCGIPPGERDAVFEAGYTTAAKYGGPVWDWRSSRNWPRCTGGSAR